jgi:signal transduction histidine kinase
LRRLAAAGSILLPPQAACQGGPRDREELQVTLKIAGDRALPEPVLAALYAIVQEALTNAARHAGVREATVRLNLVEPPAFLEVEDRGCGFVPQAVAGAGGHLGLTGMAERARDAGWRLVVDSEPGHGTRIRVEECMYEAASQEARR